MAAHGGPWGPFGTHGDPLLLLCRALKAVHAAMREYIHTTSAITPKYHRLELFKSIHGDPWEPMGTLLEHLGAHAYGGPTWAPNGLQFKP